MASSESFDGAYLLLLSRLWLDFQALREAMVSAIAAPDQQEEVLTHAEILLLELKVLQHRSGRLQEFGQLTPQQGQRLLRTLNDVNGLWEFDPSELNIVGLVRIDRAQNRLFDEVQQLALQWREPLRRAG